MWHGYFGIENLALNDTQRATLIDALRAMGPETHSSPACLNHWRTRLDNQAAIFEAQFNTAALTVDAFKSRLAAIFDINPDTNNHTLNTVHFSPRGSSTVAVFSVTGTDYLRLALFGGPSANRSQSLDECTAYLELYRDQWEGA